MQNQATSFKYKLIHIMMYSIKDARFLKTNLNITVKACHRTPGLDAE